MTDVVVVTGVGGMGVACARRLGGSAHLVLADFDEAKLGAVVDEFTRDGFTVTGQRVDVSDPASVGALVAVVAWAGIAAHARAHRRPLTHAGVRRSACLEVDMLGTEHVLERVPRRGGAGHGRGLHRQHGRLDGRAATRELEHAVTRATTDGLMDALGDMDLSDFGATYSVAKRVNQLRVEQAAVAWGPRGGRVVSISPGIISTPDGPQELAEGAGEQMQGMLDISPVPRIGTAEDIAAAVQWLASPAASFVSGCDLRVDGGVTAAVRGLLAAG